MGNLSNKDRAIKWGLENEKVIKRFKSKLFPMEDGCIGIKGAEWDSRDRYRPFTIASAKNNVNSTVKAHRFAFALYYGFDALPKGMSGCKSDRIAINHICGNPKCVNPDHLELITSKENSVYRGPKSSKGKGGRPNAKGM
jgi:hypothetical protein